jgi:hypothetical protein
MHAMQGAYHAHHRAADMAGLLVVVGLAVAVAVAILVSTAARPASQSVDPPATIAITSPWLGGIYRANLVGADTIPVAALQKVFDPTELQAIVAARTQAEALAASRADQSWLNGQLRAFKANAPAVAPATVPAPDNSRFEGKPLPN